MTEATETQVMPGDDVAFPEDGPSSGGGIARASDSSFTLAEPGTYLVQFTLTAKDSGQLALTLNDTELDYTIFGRYAGMTQLNGAALVTTESANAVLTVRNPSGNTTCVNLSPEACGEQPVSAHLVIIRLQ